MCNGSICFLLSYFKALRTVSCSPSEIKITRKINKLLDIIINSYCIIYNKLLLS